MTNAEVVTEATTIIICNHRIHDSLEAILFPVNKALPLSEEAKLAKVVVSVLSHDHKAEVIQLLLERICTDMFRVLSTLTLNMLNPA